jgi:hypothetical protein
MSSASDLLLIYQFLKRLTTPWDKTDAYKLGIIDSEGKLIKKMSELKTSEEKAAYGYFDRLVFNVKRLLEKLPGGKTRLASYAAALFLIKECTNPKENYTDDEIFQALEENYDVMDKTTMKKLNELMEDAPANATGPAVAGTNGDVSWKMDGRTKKTKAFLRRYSEEKGKRDARKKRKDFFKQLGIDV